jgi:hypothetical protein
VISAARAEADGKADERQRALRDRGARTGAHCADLVGKVKSGEASLHGALCQLTSWRGL